MQEPCCLPMIRTSPVLVWVLETCGLLFLMPSTIPCWNGIGAPTSGCSVPANAAFSAYPCHDLQVVGEKEEAEGTVNVRTRDNVVHGMHSLASVQQVLLEEKASRSLASIFSAHEDAPSTEAADLYAQNGAAVAAAQ